MILLSFDICEFKMDLQWEFMRFGESSWDFVRFHDESWDITVCHCLWVCAPSQWYRTTLFNTDLRCVSWWTMGTYVFWWLTMHMQIKVRNVVLYWSAWLLFESHSWLPFYYVCKVNSIKGRDFYYIHWIPVSRLRDDRLQRSNNCAPPLKVSYLNSDYLWECTYFEAHRGMEVPVQWCNGKCLMCCFSSRIP